MYVEQSFDVLQKYHAWQAVLYVVEDVLDAIRALVLASYALHTEPQATQLKGLRHQPLRQGHRASRSEGLRASENVGTEAKGSLGWGRWGLRVEQIPSRPAPVVVSLPNTAK